MEKLNYKIGNRLKECRTEAGLTQAQLAKQVDVSVQHVSYIECGKRRLTADLAKKMAEALKVADAYLLCEVDFKSLQEQLHEDKKYGEYMCDIIVKFFNFMDIRIEFLCAVENQENLYPEKFYGDVYSRNWSCRFNDGSIQPASLEEVKLTGSGVSFFRSSINTHMSDAVYLSHAEFSTFLSDIGESISFFLYRLRNTYTGNRENIHNKLAYYRDSSSNSALYGDHLFFKEDGGRNVIKREYHKYGEW